MIPHCHLDGWIMKIYTKIYRRCGGKKRARDVKHLLAIGVTLSRFEQAYDSLRNLIMSHLLVVCIP